MQRGSRTPSEQRYLRRYIWLIALAWSVVVAGLATWFIVEQRAGYLEKARDQARIAYEKDLLYRRWCSSYGGVYVQVPEDANATSDVWLSIAPEVTTTSAKVLKLITPEVMTRQVYANQLEESGILAHITSLKPLNPANAPDAWERKALEAFERGETEVSGVQVVDGEPYMHLERPLYVEESCLVCHRTQGYELGDVRGGISVAVPIKPLQEAAAKERLTILFGYGFVWLIGIAGISVGGRGLARRISEREQAVGKLAESEERFRGLFEQSNDAIFVYTCDGRILDVNHRASELLGCRREELAGNTIIAFHPDEEQGRARQALRTVVEQGAVRFESLVTHRDGRVLNVEISAAVVDKERGLVQGVVRDITECKRAEEVLRKKSEELRQQQKLEAVGELAGGIAHEFNNLLHAVRGFAKCAMEGLLPEEQRYQDLQQVFKAADRATTLTRQLLSFSHHQVLERKNVDPNQVVTDLAKMVRPLIGAHMELDVILGENVGTVCADLGQLQQVLLNLCLNARDAMPSGGQLMIKTENVVLSDAFCEVYPEAKSGRHVSLIVADTGCGMPPEVRQRIFEPFYTTKGVGEGTGLGLAVVHGIVEQHKGTIHVYSEPGQGTTFRIYLPTVEVTSDTDGDEQTARPPGGTETILVAEDEPMVQYLTVRILANAGYTVLAASDGEAALRMFEANHDTISLVLLDVVMPRLSGLEVYHRIKADNSEVNIVFCSGYNPESANSAFIREENLHLIEKPFDPDTLLRVLREVLDTEERCQVSQTTS